MSFKMGQFSNLQHTHPGINMEVSHFNKEFKKEKKKSHPAPKAPGNHYRLDLVFD